MEFVNKEPIIYVVSGKARSGKNSVCEIIKNHYKDLKVINLAYGMEVKKLNQENYYKILV